MSWEPPRRPCDAWPAAWREALELLHGERISTTLIAMRMCKLFPQHRFTKNAIVGKLHRLGLSAPETVETMNGQCQKARRPKATEAPKRLPRNRNSGMFRPSTAKTVKPAQQPATKPDSRRNSQFFTIPRPQAPRGDIPMPGPGEPIPFEALTSTTCRWPVNDGQPAWLFCGTPRHPRSGSGDRGYCEHHWRRSISRSMTGSVA